MSNRAYLVVEGSSYGREGPPWLTPGGWFFMFEDGDVRLRRGCVSYYSTIGKCKRILASRIDALRPVSGQLPCPEIVDYLQELFLWLSDFRPDRKVMADFGELDDLLLGGGGEDEEFDDGQWRVGAGTEYLLPTSISKESFHAYAAFNVGQWMKVVEKGRWDRTEDGLRFIGIADDAWGDDEEGKFIVIGSEVEETIQFRDDWETEGPQSRHISPEEYING